ncbi:hypothetical protein Tco_0860628 [Tanacetum coccineum]|uniref:Uncharacterized protein n=1 Tax=Tanacetum coccineum TaxID=301880 RepID=A0ABQ5BG17_9ASTR
MLAKALKDYTRHKPETYRRNLLWSLNDLDKLIDERVLKYGELQMKESEVQANLSTDGTALDDSSVTEGIALDARNEYRSSNDESSSARNDANADIGHSHNSNTTSEVHHDLFKNMSVHGIQNHEQPESIPDTYLVNKNNSNVIFDITNMEPDRGKEEHDSVDNEQQRALFASWINNLKCDVKKCNEVIREAQQANTLLKNELERYKEKEKYFAKDKSIESEYCKKIKLLNDEISNLKSQACEKDKTLARENEKSDEFLECVVEENRRIHEDLKLKRRNN